MEDNSATDFILGAPTAELSMTPSQALTGGFDVDTSDDIASEAKPGRIGSASRLAGGESRQGFRIGDLRLTIRYEDSRELSEMPAIHRLPNAPDWFCGIANLHGKLTPAFDLARFIGVDEEPAAKRMLLVLSHGSDATGVVIDGLPERLRWSDEERNDIGAAPKRLLPHLLGARFIEGQLWFDLDTQSLLGEIEQSLGLAQ